MLRGSTFVALLGSAALVSMIGCSDPADSLLPTGVAVVLTDGTEVAVPVWLVRTGPDEAGDDNRLSFPAGTRAVVVKDEPVEAPKMAKLRLTRVRLVGGSHDGIEVEVPRYKLRPPG